MRENWASYRRRKDLEKRKERWNLLTEEIRRTRAIRRGAWWRGVVIGVLAMSCIVALFYIIFLWERG